MANKTKTMQQIKRILQLKIEGRSARGISRLIHISRPTVTEYLNRLERIGSPPEELLKLDDSELSSLFYAEPDPTKLPIRQKVFLERVENWLTELTKTGVTRHLLWEEYCLKNPTGYGYTQFCHYLSKYQDKKGCVMHFDYKPGEKMMVDFAGETLRMVDKETGEELRCQVFVAVLPYSGYTYVEAKVQKNYHVILGQDWHSYSVPYEYVGEYVKIIYTRDQIEIYLHLKRIAIHPRNPSRNGYSTLEEHMPPNHQYYQKIKGWNENDFKRLAQQIGTNTLVVIEKVLSSRMFHEQTYNSCLGIIRLGKKYGNQRLEAACSRVSNIPSVSYRILNNILINNMDQETDKSASFFSKVVEHENIRGALTYQ